LTSIDWLDLKIGIHPAILVLLMQKRWGDAKKECIRIAKKLKQMNYQPDGIRVVAGKSWHSPLKEAMANFEETITYSEEKMAYDEG